MRELEDGAKAIAEVESWPWATACATPSSDVVTYELTPAGWAEIRPTLPDSTGSC